MNYVTYENQSREGDDCLICLPDRFNWFAFLLPPVWALANGLWLVLSGMIGLIFFLAYAGGFLVLPGFSLYFLGALWLGFEASTLVGAKLQRRGWQDNSIVSAPSLMQAESRYFSSQRRIARATRQAQRQKEQEKPAK